MEIRERKNNIIFYITIGVVGFIVVLICSIFLFRFLSNKFSNKTKLTLENVCEYVNIHCGKVQKVHSIFNIFNKDEYTCDIKVNVDDSYEFENITIKLKMVYHCSDSQGQRKDFSFVETLNLYQNEYSKTFTVNNNIDRYYNFNSLSYEIIEVSGKIEEK